MRVNLLHSRIVIGDKPLTGFVFCEEREQRVSRVVCDINVKKGRCTKDLLKCGKSFQKKVKLIGSQYIPIDQYNASHDQMTEPTPITQLDLFGERKGTE
jgi:hypothetical protein